MVPVNPGKRIIKGRRFEVGFDRSHQRLQEGAPSRMMLSILGWMCMQQRSRRRFGIRAEIWWMEATLETKAETILEFVHGLRGSLHVSFEEGTWAACLHDL
jgi:hypothetical protein